MKRYRNPEHKSAALAGLEAIEESEIRNKLAASAKLASESAAAFFQHFRVSLRKYWDNALGLDIVKLDDDVIRSGDKCMADAVRAKYGPDALALLEKLLAK